MPSDRKVAESRRYAPDCQAAADITRETLTVPAGSRSDCRGKVTGVSASRGSSYRYKVEKVRVDDWLSDFRYEQAAGNSRHCWFGRGVVLRRNRERAGTEKEKPPETGLSGAAASVAARPKPAPTVGKQTKKNQPRTVGFLNSGGVWRHSLTLVINLNWTSLDLRIPTRERAKGSAAIANRRV